MTLDRRTCLKAMAGGLAPEVVAHEATGAPRARGSGPSRSTPSRSLIPVRSRRSRGRPSRSGAMSSSRSGARGNSSISGSGRLGGRHVDFRQTTEDALDFAARTLGNALTREHRDRLMDSYLRLRAWPDVEPALKALKQDGLRLALLSNATPEILNAGIANSGLRWAFDQVLSTDRIRTYKPDPRAYQMGVDAFGMPREEIAYVAFAGWDAAGSTWFGYPTYWANRTMAPEEGLSATPDRTGRDLAGLADFLRTGVPGISKREPISR